MKTNVKQRYEGRTHEGAPAVRVSDMETLRRSVASCFLWEKEFYEEGDEIATRIFNLALGLPASDVAALAIQTRTQNKLRHAPLMLLVALTKTGAGRDDGLVANTIFETIQRADEITEFVALYQKMGGKSLSKQAKLGLARAFTKFDEYQLAKYDRDGAWKLRDVLFMVHAKPENEEQRQLWKRLAAGELQTPDTWEVALSGGADKRETFERLLREGKLGYMALLRNLRNMDEAGVNETLVRDAIIARKGAGKMLPFRYFSAVKAAPKWAAAIDEAMSEAIAMQTLPGKTLLYIDTSGSMQNALSARSTVTRVEAAATLGALVAGNIEMFHFGNDVAALPAYRGLAGIDVVCKSIGQAGHGTRVDKVVQHANGKTADRVIIVTDEQTAVGANHRGYGYDYSRSGRVPQPNTRTYCINVASARNGIGYGKNWVHINGFSESSLRFINEYERLPA